MRKSKEAEWQAVVEETALAHFEQALGGLPDPRRRQGMRYPLRTVVVTALMAMVCGADDAEAMQEWGELNEEWLRGFLELPHGAPTQDVYLAVFGALDPARFSDVFQRWVELLDVRQKSNHEHVAIDGKTSRRSFDTGGERPAIHTVSAWLAGAGLVLGQLDTDRKTNEIKTIPELVRMLDLSGATVTIDAMGCQTEIAKTIREQGGQYLLAVKENQPTLHATIAASFADALDKRPRPQDQPAPLVVKRIGETTKAHGRVEERTLYVCHDLSWISTADRWADLHFIAMAISCRTNLTTGVTSEERRYFIGSQPDASTESIAQRIRDHWSIENQLHWVLDMAFHEDSARHRANNCAKNLTIVRHLALNLLKSEKSKKLGVANKRKCAGWDRNYLLQVLAGPRG